MSKSHPSILVANYDCFCGAQLARRWGVHRGTVTRALEAFAKYLGLEDSKVRLGREYLLTPVGVEEFKKFVTVIKAPNCKLAKAMQAEEKEEPLSPI